MKIGTVQPSDYPAHHFNARQVVGKMEDERTDYDGSGEHRALLVKQIG
jgi:hypothetical protein